METNKKLSFNIWSQFSIMLDFRNLEQIFNGIKNGAFKTLIEKIRGVANEAEKNNLKSKLYGFTISGIFNKHRRIDDLQIYTGLIVLDIDYLKPEQVNDIAARAKEIEYSILVFISPSGLGVKIIVAIDSKQEQHEAAYKQVVNYYTNQLGVDFDRKTKDITRLCYMSYDENAYYEPTAKVFHVNSIEPQSEVLTENKAEENFDKKIGYIEFRTAKHGTFNKGNRNNYIHNMASIAKRLEMKKDTITSYILEKYTSSEFQSTEIISTIESAYKRYDNQKWSYPPHVFGNKPVSCANNSVDEITHEKDCELTLDSPYISDFAKDKLPNFMRVVTTRLNPREQDVFIIGTLTALSGCIEASGMYGNKRYYSPLYSFISAPAASGKGALSYCNQLVLPLHKAFKRQSEEDQKIYEADLLEFEQKKKDGDKNIEKPEKPLFKTVMIPADSSSSQLVEHLQNNGEQGLIIDTEADTMIKMFNCEFGNYSDILRKAFEHEHISQRRKTEKLYIDMYNPRLAVCLSGTLNQFSKLASSVENGLYSRFINYVFSNTPKWNDVTPTLGVEMPLPDLIAEVGNELAVKLNEQRKQHLDFRLTKEQWEEFNNVYKGRVRQLSCFLGVEACSNIFRLAVSTFRIAMTLTVLRMIENDIYDESAICNDTDFQIAMSLSETFYQHLVYAFKIIKNTNDVLNKPLKQLLDVLPQEFDRKTAIEKVTANGINIHERTVDKYLKRLVEFEYLTKDDYNTYKRNNRNKTAA